MQNKKSIIVFILTMIGMILSIWLCKIYYDANFNPYALSSFCSVNDLIDCDGVAKTVHSQFLGVPLCIWGIILYTFIIFLLFAEKLSRVKLFKFAEVFKNPLSYIFCLSALGFILSMCLAAISIFEINKICVLCFATYFVDLAIAITAKNYHQSFFYELKQSFSDFVDAIKIKPYLIAFIIVVTAFAGILVYTEKSKILAPQIKKLSFEGYNTQKYHNDDNSLGDKNARVVVHEYMDYNCASCYITNVSLRRLVTELDNLLIIQHNFPLDGECNKLITNGHEGSCRMARYALAAKKQGKYWEANEILFDKTPTSEKDIIKCLSKIKGINKKQLIEDANSDEVKKELLSEINNALNQKLEGTPSLIINIQKYTGNIPYNDLKQKLISAGATEKENK